MRGICHAWCVHVYVIQVVALLLVANFGCLSWVFIKSSLSIKSRVPAEMLKSHPIRFALSIFVDSWHFEIFLGAPLLNLHTISILITKWKVYRVSGFIYVASYIIIYKEFWLSTYLVLFDWIFIYQSQRTWRPKRKPNCFGYCNSKYGPLFHGRFHYWACHQHVFALVLDVLDWW